MKLYEVPLQKQMLKILFSKIQSGGLKVKYWDGEIANYGDEIPAVTLIFNHSPSSLFSCDDPVRTLGEAYMERVIDYEGPLEELLLLIEKNKQAFAKTSAVANVLKAITGKIDMNQAKQNIQHHYDLGNDFFSLWLDDTMSYSCAYFKQPGDSLYQAQLQKVDHILKKLRLKSGEFLLDIGCGWGWLITKAAQNYGVKAMGITLSEEQYRATKQRISELGLEENVNVELMNYLELDEARYKFDKIVSVGMFEHVGKENIPRYFDKVNHLLKQGGVSLLHTITDTLETKLENTWIKTYIFPGGYVPSLREVVWQLPEYDFHLQHLESLRMHYAMTLDCWYKNFAENIEAVRQKFDDRFIRMWELYLKGCAAAFRATGLDIHQLLFTKGLNNALPLTYESVYK